jgi:hypothetical protein
MTSERQIIETPNDDAPNRISSTRSLPGSWTYRLASAEESKKMFKVTTASPPAQL